LGGAPPQKSSVEITGLSSSGSGNLNGNTPVEDRVGVSRPKEITDQSIDQPVDESALFKTLVKRGKDGGPSRVKFSDAEEQCLVAKIQNDFESADVSGRQFKLNQLEMLANWRGTPNDKDLPFEGASNIHVPLTSSYMETMKARIVKAIFGDNENITQIHRIDAQIDKEALEEMNTWFQWELDEIIHFKEHFKDIVHNTLLTGIGISVPSYRNETRMLHSRREFDLNELTSQEQFSLSDFIERAIEQIINEKSEWGIEQSLSITKQSKLGKYELSDGGKIEFSVDQDAIPPSLVADVWKREVRFNGVKCYCVNLEDLVVVNSASSIDDIPFFGIRGFDTLTEFREAIKDGFYIDRGEEENNAIWENADIKIGQYINREQTNLQDAEEGTDSTDSSTNNPRDEVLEWYRWEGWWSPAEVEGSPDSENFLSAAVQLIVYVPAKGNKILHIVRVEDHNKDGKRSGIKFDFIKEPNRFYSMGLAEWVRHSQAELDAIHNQRLDAGLLTNLPFGFYKPTAGIKPQMIKVEPGKLWPVADPQGINFPRTNWQPTFSFQEEALVYRYAGEQAGLTAPATGQFTSKRTSASEFVGTAAALDLRTEDIVEGFVNSLREEFLRILGLYQQYGPRERIFRAGGEGGVELTKRFEKDRLNGKILLKLTANLAQINEQLQRQLALDMLQLLLNEILITSGIVGPDTIYQAVEKLVKLSHYHGVTLHQPNLPPLSDPPNVENHQMFAGQKPKGPTMGENFNEHLQVHSMLAADKKTMMSWTPEARQLLQQHLQMTLQMQQASQILLQQQAAMATQMAGTMAEKGIRPGKAGNQKPGGNTGPGTKAEGVRTEGNNGPTAQAPAGQ
jgi:hypothetical protein